MAEIVEFHNEESIPELETMLLQLFEKDEVKSIINLRNSLEYKLNRTPKNKDDCYKFIDNELKLLRIVKLRHKKKGLQKNTKLANLEMSLKNRINKLFILCIRWFPSDLRVWMTYIRFCQQHKTNTATSRLLEQMLEMHGSAQPQLYKLAADWERVECKCLEKARKHLMMGIHVHKDNKLLLKEAFSLELMDAEKKRKDCIANNMAIDPTNSHLTAKKAECIYECSIKKMKDVELMDDLMKICQKYDFTSTLHSKISSDMFLFDTNERMWDIIATRELNNNESTFKHKIGKCISLYETAVKRVNTTTMWTYYIDTLLEVLKDETVLPVYKRKLLMSAMQKAAANGKLTEKYYLIWVSYLQGQEKHKKLIEVLQGAVKKIPDSVKLWHTLLRAYLNKGDERQAAVVFDQAVAALNKNSLSLWKLMLQFEQTRRNSKVEEIFKKSWTQVPEISGPLKAMYLEWLTLTQGILAARKMYDYMTSLERPTLEMHKKIIYLETIQPIWNMKRIRSTYVHACVTFGNDDVDVWMDFVKFETNHGDPDRVSEIYWKARAELQSHLVETFLSEYSLIHTIPIKSGPA